MAKLAFKSALFGFRVGGYVQMSYCLPARRLKGDSLDEWWNGIQALLWERMQSVLRELAWMAVHSLHGMLG